MFCIDTVQDETRLWVGGKGKGKGKVMVEGKGKGKVMVASGVAVDKLGAEFPGWLQSCGFLEAVLWRARAKDEMPQERTGASFIDECSEDEVWANDMIELKTRTVKKISVAAQATCWTTQSGSSGPISSFFVLWRQSCVWPS